MVVSIFFLYIYIYMYVYIYMYIYYGRDKRAGWERLTFGMGQVKNFESRFYFHIFRYMDIQKMIKFKFLDPRIFGYPNFGYTKFRISEFLDISDSDIGYSGSDFWIHIVLNTSNFHTTSLLIAAAPVTPCAPMVDYHRHTCTLILTITLIYTFLISIIFSTTNPNVLNQLRKALDLSNNNFSPPQPKYNPSMKLVLGGNTLFQSDSSKIPPKPSSPSGSQHESSTQLSPGITPSTGDLGIGGVPAIQLKKKLDVVPSLTPVAAFAGLALLTVPLGFYLCKLKKAYSSEPPSSVVIHPWTCLTRITQSGFQLPRTHR
ncbi:hypothetical protein HanOQP8_Chr14g0521291 [Helianthus annuus]|nr:hypothetical protein HanHA89_Chr14g0560641 [Helianthus annuus]KAJ0655333.1 hypothetical protein HanLR1_Chr14g0522961 [Helianthus annuus]KAJ0659026.1 hypothetical protein HanOQP8_Chr14g0521291 [Helianthus annuus]KAJ0839281.1 hypothetical protein HanPSC8_Chr14g0604961 [Helianthus annuus]